MNIKEELLRLFQQQQDENRGAVRSLVFWYDAQGESRDLTEIEEALSERGIRIHHVEENNVFRTKVLLELEDTENSYLLYAPFAKPADRDNFLLDILLYSGKHGEFQADEIAIRMKELRLDHLAIRPFMEEHTRFFENKQRVARFQKLLANNPTVEQVKQTMLAVLCNAKSSTPQDILKSVAAHGLSDTNESLTQIAKYMDAEVFHSFVEEYFGIAKREEQRFAHIVESIVFQHYAAHLDEKMMQVTYVSAVPNICKVFVEDWLKSEERKVLEQILDTLEQKWNVSQAIERYTYQAFLRCDTFAAVERKILDVLHELLLNETIVVSEWKSILAERSKSYWYKTRFHAEYELLEKALRVYEWRGVFEKNDAPRNEREWFALYTEKYFHIDQAYRHLQLHYANGHGLDAYEALMERMTFWYENTYLTELSRYTDEMVDMKLREKWPITDVLQQKNFYNYFIRPLVEGSRERIFVIISDALRFEIGEELKSSFNQRLNAEVRLIPMQAAAPTYTQLGMAALLPGSITDVASDGTVYVDGLSTKGLVNRNKILQTYEPDAVALKLDSFISCSKEEGFSQIKGKRVVYLYHDNIDATGDSGKTEGYTYEAVVQTVERIKAAVRKLTGTYEAVRIYITSDHGFLYQSSQVEKYQKTESIQGDIYDRNRRFAIGHSLSTPEGTTKVSMQYLGLSHEAVIAKGLNRFTAGGGMRFVHGGAMPQESIVPLIEYRQVRGKARKAEEERVNVRVASIQKVITSYQFIVPFFQEEKVSGELYARTLRAAFYRNNERISNELTVTFDSKGEVAERQKDVVFHLLEDRYKTGDVCVLRLEDVSGRATELYGEEEFELKLYSI
ncbi:BREX-1 system phosphatase PglZ type A [Ectobacillus sp. JY-23]|uniref:BREX-1 system phosphatase PglZ type A n=1 Tax=Ectobacillus sp. JY-23 TaxID=2933872 RepID=UPI001FF46009|nr:BREX-1 system phosphatase PglZ type A [Ectobacillus sp. JY-23]UOY92505.1 BREX-1 system phosphatase PglZ type A [Ectobacillus sp. JY-23]